MPTSAHCIHPVSAAFEINKDALTEPMKHQCMMCGVKRNNPPYTGDFSYTQDRVTKVIKVKTYAYLCSPTCKRNWAKEFRFNPQEATVSCFRTLTKMSGVSIDPERRCPPLLAHERFGGECKDADYINPAYNYPHADSRNPFVYRPWDPKDEAWQRDYTGSGLACWGCLQEIHGKACTLPIRYSDETKLVTHTMGLFHRNGRCALRRRLKMHNGLTWLDIFWATQLLTAEPFNLDPDTLIAASDPLMLDVFGGIFSLDRYLNAPLNEIYIVNYMGVNAYPYHPTGELETILQLETIVTKDEGKDPMSLRKKHEQPLLVMDRKADGTVWMSEPALFVIERMTEVLSFAHAERLQRKGLLPASKSS